MTNIQTKMNYKQLTEDIADWIKQYTINNGLKSLIVGVSGGCDSGLVSTLCAKTGLPTYCYGLPIISHPENNKNSEIQLNWLKSNFPNVKTEIKDLSDTYITFKDGLNLNDLTKANTKSRLRMVFLYAMAGNYDGLVVGCGNVIEDFHCFFYTKYGDGGVDISPIADLKKSEVRELGKFLQIPQEIHSAIATDGLWEDNRKDHDQLNGATYDELEEIMELSKTRIADMNELTDRQKEVYKIYLKFHKKGKHKSLPIPVFKVDKSKY